jgi:hypothetical protein
MARGWQARAARRARATRSERATAADRWALATVRARR